MLLNTNLPGERFKYSLAPTIININLNIIIIIIIIIVIIIIIIIISVTIIIVITICMLHSIGGNAGNLSLLNHKSYNFLDCDWFRKLQFFTNSLAKLSSDTFLSGTLLSDSSISHPHSK